jgi:hypothetical protein
MTSWQLREQVQHLTESDIDRCGPVAAATRPAAWRVWPEQVVVDGEAYILQGAHVTTTATWADYQARRRDLLRLRIYGDPS